MGEKEGETGGRKSYQKALMDLIGCRPVAYWPYLARRIGGVKAAVMLSQLLYWNGDSTVQKRDGWLRKSVEDMENETGLNKTEQKNARKTLSTAGIIECTLKGYPKIWHYRVNMERLAESIVGEQTHSTSNSFNEKIIQRQNHSMTNSPVVGAQTNPSLGEFVAQLNNELKTTVNKTTVNKTTSSSSAESKSYPQGERQEDEVPSGFVFSERLLKKFREIGVFDDRYPEIAAKEWTDDQLMTLINQAAADDREKKPGSVAKLFIYRLRVTSKPPMTAEERDRADRQRYTAGLPEYDANDPDQEPTDD